MQYPRAVFAALTGATALALAASAALIYGAGPPVDLEIRVVLFSLALIGIAMAWKSGAAASFQRIHAQRRCFYSTFMASLIEPRSWQQFRGLALSDIANDPLPLMPAVPARSSDTPDIIIIQHKLVFDPR